MDKLQWFKFSYADWRMGKIQRCPEITQSRFINLCCLYWSKEANLSYEDAVIEIEKEHLDILIQKKIVDHNEEHIFIKFLDEQLEEIHKTSKGKSKAANIRWQRYREEKKKDSKNADAMHVHKSAMQNNADKIREDKIREDNINFKALVDFINKVGNRNFKTINDKSKRQYKARLKEGYEKEQIFLAIQNAYKAQNHIDSNFKYLTPEFFSRADKLDMYGFEKPKKDKPKPITESLYD